MMSPDENQTGAPRPTDAKALLVWERLAVVALGLFAFAMRFRMATRDPDTFWHIATGRYIVQHGAIPTTDPFSWYGSAKQLTWTVQEWLFGVLAHGVDALGGTTALSVIGALFVAAIAVGLYYLIRERTGSVLIALSLAAFATVIVGGMGAFRPQVLTNLLIVITLILLQKRKYFWAIPVMVLSLNLHGGNWPVYVIIIGLWTAFRDWRVLPLTLIAPMLNPKGFELIPYPFATLSYDFSQIAEFAPTTLQYSESQIFLLTMVLLVLLVDIRRISLRDGILAGAFTVLGLSSFRHTVFWSIVVIPVLSPYMVVRIREITSWVIRHLEPTKLRGFTTFTLSQQVSLAAIGIATSALLLIGQIPGDMAQGAWPHEAVPYPSDKILAYLEEHGTEGMFTEYNSGGYLIYHGIKPMMDSRADLYSPISNPGETMMDDYFGLLKTMSVGEFAEKYDLDTFVVTDNTTIELSLRDNPNYRVLLSDGGFSIYELAR